MAPAERAGYPALKVADGGLCVSDSTGLEADI